MALTLTPLFSDSFTRANVAPLASPWALDEAGDPGLQIVSDLCESDDTSFSVGGGSQIYEETLPDDQYVSVTVGTTLTGVGASLYIRVTDEGTTVGEGGPGNQYRLTCRSGGWAVYSLGGLIASGSLTVSIGDTLTLAAVGTTIYAFHNSTQLAAVTDANAASGFAALTVENGEFSGAASVSNFVVGSASVPVPPPISGPFLGSVVVSDSDSDPASPFLGSVHVISAPPDGNPTGYPFLGRVKLGAAPAGASGKIILGTVVLVDAPGDNPDAFPFLGTVESL